MHIGDICTKVVVTCRRDASALALARIMREQHVGDVVIVDDCEGGVQPVGIVTDRDLAVKVMAMELPPEQLRAEDLMGTELVTALASETVYDAIWHMRSHGVRRLPIVDAQCRLQGLLTADDLVNFVAQELSALARLAPYQSHREKETAVPVKAAR